MATRSSALLGLLLAPMLFGQVSWNSVTVTASRSADTVTGDQAVMGVYVNSSSGQALDEIVQALAPAGITAADFAGFTGTSAGQILQPAVQWAFRLTTPVAKLKETNAALAELQQAMVKKGNGMSLSFSVQGTQATAQTPACNLADLMADARAQAEKLAGAAGLTPGMIVGLTSTTGGPAPICYLTVRFALGMMFGQTDPDMIGISASRTINPAPDQVLTSLMIYSGPSAGVDEVTAALRSAGITGVSLTGVNTITGFSQVGQPPRPMLQWSFTMPVPMDEFKAIVARLAAAQKSLPQAGTDMSMPYYSGTPSLSPAAQQKPSCPQSDLVADARAYAQKVAAAAGVTAGPILSMSGSGSLSSAGYPNWVPVPVFRSGDFSASGLSGIAIGSAILTTPMPAPSYYGCSVGVQFQLVH